VNTLFDQEFNDPTYGGDYDSGGSSAGDYAGDAAYYAKEGAVAAKNGIKKLIPIIIVGIIALVVIGFVFSWLGSQQTVNFTIKELDGSAISGARLIITDSSGNKVLNKSGSNQTLTLGPGIYSIRATSMNHKDFDESLEIPQVDDGGQRKDSYVALMQKSLEGKVIIDLAQTKIYEKQTITGELRIENTGDDDMIDEEILVDTGTSSDLKGDINFSPSLFTVSAGGSTLISFSMTLNKDITKTGENEAIKFRIAGTQIKDDTQITLVPAVSEKLIVIAGDVKNDNINKDNLVSGDQEDIDIRIENKDKTLPLENVTLRVEAENGFEDKLSWFEFADAGAQPHETTIGSISPNRGKETAILQVTPSIDAEVGDGFEGTIIIESLSIEERQIPINIVLTIKSQKSAELSFQEKDFTTTCYSNQAPCKAINTIDTITLKNTGDVAIENIQLGLESETSDADCEFWMEFTSDKISSLDVSEEKALSFKINVPDGTTTQYTGCYLKAAYVDPLTSATNVDVSEPVKITITVKESP
jgi:hypothetical protein